MNCFRLLQEYSLGLLGVHEIFFVRFSLERISLFDFFVLYVPPTITFLMARKYVSEQRHVNQKWAFS